MMQMCKRDLIEMHEYTVSIMGNQLSVAVSNQQDRVVHCENTIKSMSTHWVK